MKYTIELTTAERDVICNLISTIRDNSLGEHRLFEDTTLCKFDEKSTDYDAVYRKGIEEGNKIADKNFKEIRDSAYDVAYNKGVEDFENLFVHEHDYEQFFEDTYGSKDPGYNLYDLVAEYGAKKVIDDLKKWVEKKKVKEEIKVGDEVKDLATDNIGIVMSIGKLIVYITNNGVYTNTLGSLEKTGRHFDEVSQLLDKLREEQ